MNTLKLRPLYDKLSNLIEITMRDIDYTGGVSDSKALPFLYQSIEGFYVLCFSILEASKEPDQEDFDHMVYRTIEVISQEIQGKTALQKSTMRWVKNEIFEKDPTAGRVRQKRSASMVRATEYLKLKMAIDNDDLSVEVITRLKILYILALPLIRVLGETALYLSKIQETGIKNLELITNMLMVLSELRAMALTRATIKDILMLQIRRGITDNFLKAGRSSKVVNDAISAIVDQYQNFPDLELRKTIESTLGTKEQMKTYLSVQEQT